MEPPLTAVDVRVLGSLIEKSLTTPEYYPLTLHSLVAACNQKSNRDPVMQLEDTVVIRTLDAMRDRKLVWSVAEAGSRAPKYRHSVLDVVKLTPLQLGVLCELMLRGQQTASELRLRVARMAPVVDSAEVETVLKSLVDWPEGPLAHRLPCQAGQRGERYAHSLSGDMPPVTAAVELPVEPARVIVMGENGRIAALETRVAALDAELASLRMQLTGFIQQFK